MAAQQTILITGGSGFVGRHLANRLTDLGLRVRIPVRRRERCKHLLVNPMIEVCEANIHDPEQLWPLLDDCSAAIHLVGILNEHKSGDFHRTHVDLVQKLVHACKLHGVPRLLHMSALNANAHASKGDYLRTKGEGQALAHREAGDDLAVTSFRPSVIFGHDDSFFNRFATLLKLMPVAFPLACPKARFAPVYVGDVVDAFVTALQDDSLAGQSLELCGPKEYSLEELVRYTAQQLGLQRMIVGLPDFAARLQGRILQHVPGTPFSLDNYWSLQIDSICTNNGFDRLGITPRSLESIVPAYLGNQRSRARYHQYRALAKRP